MSEIGAYLKQLRTSRGFSLRDVERITDGKVSNAYLSQVETGKVKHPTAIMLHRLSVAYCSDLAEMLEAAGENFIAPVSVCPTCGQFAPNTTGKAPEAAREGS